VYNSLRNSIQSIIFCKNTKQSSLFRVLLVDADLGTMNAYFNKIVVPVHIAKCEKILVFQNKNTIFLVLFYLRNDLILIML